MIGWLKNNTPITSGTVSQNETISLLVIVFNETTENPIKYRCIARNSLGSTLSKEATLTVRARIEGRGRFQRVQAILDFHNTQYRHAYIYYSQAETLKLPYLTNVTVFTLKYIYILL